jgi:hypothetical protein
MLNMRRLITCVILSCFPLACLAEGSPWLPEPSSGNINLSYVYQNADKFYNKERRVLTPGGGEDLEQQTVWLSANYAIMDNLAIDMKTGWAKSQFALVGPTISESFDGMVDSSIGITWRFVDEWISESGLPSMAIRVAGIIAGDYETGYINSIGDGGDGGEISFLMGKIFGDKLGLSTEVGYRDRTDEIPEEIFVNLGAYYLMGPMTASLEYKWNNALDGLQIGEPGFAPDPINQPKLRRFPELEEDFRAIAFGLSYRIGETVNIGVNFASVVDGRNTNDANAVGLTIGYSFDTF